MRLYDRTSPGPQKPLFRAPAIASLEGRSIGILENGKLDAVEMLCELSALFEARHMQRDSHCDFRYRLNK
jgi:hypothetical protein